MIWAAALAYSKLPTLPLEGMVGEAEPILIKPELAKVADPADKVALFAFKSKVELLAVMVKVPLTVIFPPAVSVPLELLKVRLL